MTNILRWDKPKAKLSPADWKESYGFDGGPSGGYIPNMSEADAQSWKAKLTGTKLGFPQVEIRKTVRGSQLLLIVNLGAGYNYKFYNARDDKYPHPFTKAAYSQMNPQHMRFMNDYDEDHFRRMGAPTEGINVHVALNGPAQMTFDEMTEMQQAVQEAKAFLEGLEPK